MPAHYVRVFLNFMVSKVVKDRCKSREFLSVLFFSFFICFFFCYWCCCFLFNVLLILAVCFFSCFFLQNFDILQFFFSKNRTTSKNSFIRVWLIYRIEFFFLYLIFVSIQLLFTFLFVGFFFVYFFFCWCCVFACFLFFFSLHWVLGFFLFFLFFKFNVVFFKNWFVVVTKNWQKKNLMAFLLRGFFSLIFSKFFFPLFQNLKKVSDKNYGI